MRKCFKQIHSLGKVWTGGEFYDMRKALKCRHDNWYCWGPKGLCSCFGDNVSQKIKLVNCEHQVETEKAARRAAEVARERQMAKFAAAVRGHDIRGICRSDIWGEWEYQGCPQISAEWIRDLVANRYVQFVFEDLSTFNQPAYYDKKWVKPRLYPDTFLNDNWYFTGLRSLD